MQSRYREGAIDKWVFYPALIVTLIMGVYFLYDPAGSNALLGKIHSFTTNELGWFFLVTTFAAVSFCLYLALGRMGGIVLGDAGQKPTFSTFTWLGLIFTSGTGGSVLYLGSVEWIWIMQSPPFGIEAGSNDAARWASAYGMFHWGPSAWAWYICCAIPMGYFFFIRKQKNMKINEFVRPVLGKQSDGLAGHAVNFLYMFGMIGGVMTSLALGTPAISGVIVYLFGWESSNAFVDTFVIFLWTFIPLAALIFGLEKGVSLLSKWNVRLDIAWLIGILICGPTAFILNQSVDGLGLLLQNFIYMSFVTDVLRKTGFPQGWTVFYFAWWVVYAVPFGLFIAKISKGRTIREIVFGGLIFGSLGCMVFYMVLPGFGIELQTTGQADLMAAMSEGGRGKVVTTMLSHLPVSALFIFLFGLIALISYITGHCAVGYALAAATQQELRDDQDPAKWNVAFWLILAGGVSLALYFINPESLKPLQTVSILTGFPLVFVVYLLCASFMKAIKQDYARGLPEPDADAKIWLKLDAKAPAE
ncbi:BCCT family transporter [uncultured Cohaesibacter sp.]|uniref:BCCT family transporter n=1 Tax=uncultured Cohaesibacter sp. TaxID=1002546 RepID=UPI0029C7C195|nr:BCCT family transporter [uncultured Cohaesibacter sp.]